MSLLEMTRPVQLAGEKRVHRLGKPDELEDDRPKAAPLPPAAEETAMPRGVYPRKAKTDPEAKAVSEKPKKTKAKKAKPTRAEAKALKPSRVAARLASTNGHEPNFVVDDTGRVAIIDGATRIDLSLSATKRLALFIDRTKSFRP